MEENILSVHVKINESYEVHGKGVTVNMVNFHGTAESKYFSGEILPGGVDTQIYGDGEKGRLSARYIIEGKDCTGEKCRIFIENNGIHEESGIMTKPVIITDSKELSWMMDAKLEGRIREEENGICIEIICVLEKEENI